MAKIGPRGGTRRSKIVSEQRKLRCLIPEERQFFLSLKECWYTKICNPQDDEWSKNLVLGEFWASTGFLSVSNNPAFQQQTIRALWQLWERYVELGAALQYVFLTQWTCWQFWCTPNLYLCLRLVALHNSRICNNSRNVVISGYWRKLNIITCWS